MSTGRLVWEASACDALPRSALRIGPRPRGGLSIGRDRAAFREGRGLRVSHCSRWRVSGSHFGGPICERSDGMGRSQEAPRHPQVCALAMPALAP
jgi:hypothetical protein